MNLLKISQTMLHFYKLDSDFRYNIYMIDQIIKEVMREEDNGKTKD
jgi:hypothetical protein